MPEQIKILMIDPRRNITLPLTCSNCAVCDVWTCKKYAMDEIENPYKQRRPDCPAIEIGI